MYSSTAWRLGTPVAPMCSTAMDAVILAKRAACSASPVSCKWIKKAVVMVSPAPVGSLSRAGRGVLGYNARLSERKVLLAR